MQFDPSKASLAHSHSLCLDWLSLTHTLHLWLCLSHNTHTHTQISMRISFLKEKKKPMMLSLSTSVRNLINQQTYRTFPWKTSYLFKMTRTRPHKHHRMISVSVRGHRGHAVRPLVVQRRPFDHPQPSERLVQDQAAKIVSYLLRLERRNNTGEFYYIAGEFSNLINRLKEQGFVL